MSGLTYQNFDLSIEPDGCGRYRAKGFDSSARTATIKVAGDLAKVESAGFSSPQASARRLGERLFDAVFQGDLLSIFRASQEDSRTQQHGLRIRLRLTDVPELARLPWEYLYDSLNGRFFALSGTTPVVRYLELPEPVSRPAAEHPLRILVMIANPRNLERLDADGEWKLLNEALGDLQEQGQVDLQRLEEPTLSSLQRNIRSHRPHVLHFIGHGLFQDHLQEGALVLEDDRGHSHAVGSRQLGVILHGSSLRLAFLNACHGAQASLSDPFSGVAQNLVRQGIPAVLGMQRELSDRTAINLAKEFYLALTDGYPVDASLAEARKSLSGSSTLEWGTPILFLRSPDGHLFDRSPREGSHSVGVDEPPPITGLLSTIDPEPPVEPAHIQEPGHWLHFLLDKKKELLALLGGVPTLIYGLGLLALHSRENLLGLVQPLSYPHQETLLTGLDVLWRLPWAALSGLLSSNRWLLAGAWGTLAVLWLAWTLAQRRLNRWARYGLFGLLWLIILFGLRFQIAALFPPHHQDGPVFPSFEVSLSRHAIDQTSFEAISWLTNETDLNARLRHELNGLVLWLLLAAGALGWAAWRQREAPAWGRRLLMVAFTLQALLAVNILPRGYAMARWGVAYPTAAIHGGVACDTQLSAAVEAGQCCVYDVSAGGRPLTTVLRGRCPATVPLIAWPGDRSSCVTPIGRPKVIDDEC